MVENKDYEAQNADKTVKEGLFNFLKDVLCGVLIGVAFIIPGFSGGSVAAILGIYEKMISAIADVFKDMRRSIITLLPIGIGLVLGAVSLLFPLGWALSAYPLPTVSLFVGLAIGGIPSITDKLKKGMTPGYAAACGIPLALALALSFIPTGADVNLLSLNVGGYVLLFVIGVIGSCALVVPGISGSMLLLILGYYNPLIKLITEHFFKGKDLMTCVLVLGACGLGIAFGFLMISIIMKKLLERYPTGTYFAIIGFIVGSLPTVYVSTMKDAGMLTSALKLVYMPTSVLYWVFCVAMMASGIVAAYSFVRYMTKKDLN